MRAIKSPPSISTPEHIHVPFPRLTTLNNGVNVHSLEFTDHDVIRFSFVFDAGSTLQGVPFCASSTANLLSEGSARFSSKEISEHLDFHGSYYSVSFDRDYSVLTFATLSKFLEPTLDIAREILLHPTFPEEELSIYRSNRKHLLSIERSKGSFRARELFAESLFGVNHPYGVGFPESSYDSLTRSDVESFYKKYYTSANCFMVCSGNINPDNLLSICSLASDIPVSGGFCRVPFGAPGSSSFVFSSHEGSMQSNIRIGKLLFTRTHPDFIPMQVVCSILGGYFGSRLVRNLREKNGYTYGIFSSLINLKYDGYLAIATDVGSDVTLNSIREIFNEITLLRESLVSDSELSMVRNIMIGEVLRILDGPFGIVDITIEGIQSGSDNSYLSDFLDIVRTISPEDIRYLALKYLTPESFTVVVVGSPSLEADLNSASFFGICN